ncbi:hypothetical protein QBC46DRAFT_345283 [Diplogelasinospora grovesii]|uniref:Uncharacterized protein n=1 Tax=Diplogelasinospora grovesii TaxID=303347 RepID=A0AAN6S0K1_9PEZI|nr:hypothetical protein QBC46DRAFT_345283 [Diplogelasinospora grovesii]
MGVDAGFDVLPTLRTSFQSRHDGFIEAVMLEYQYVVNPRTGESLINIVGDREAKRGYIWFKIGEAPRLPLRCEYFLRFSSKLVNREDVSLT